MTERTTEALDAPHTVPPEVLARRLRTDLAAGLNAGEASARLARHGPNRLETAPRPGPLRRVLSQFRDPLIYVLLAAGFVALAFGGYVDAGVIGGVVLLNALIGYVQESRAAHALDALTRLVPLDAIVVRSGRARRVPVEEVVPGDVVELAGGDRVPADVRLVEVHALEVDESALTGESVPVSKAVAVLPDDTTVADRTNAAYAGTVVARGSARALVVATGAATQLGGIQRMVTGAGTVATPLTRKLAGFSRQLTVGVVAVAVVAFTVGLVRGASVPEVFTAAVALAVGAIPEGLPAAMTIVLAIGVVRMSRRGAIVRHLPAVETLGSTTVICTDKTGTLTRNRMTVSEVAADGRVVPPEEAGVSPALLECLVAGVLCNTAEPDEGDPTERALLAAAVVAGVDVAALRAAAPRTDVVPFEPERRLMTTVHGDRGYVKGAVEEVLALCRDTLGHAGVDRVMRTHRKLTERGLRVLAFARFSPSASPRPIFLGLQAMRDPPRPDAAAAVKACHGAGIDVKMITGDHPGTARAIASSVGLAAEPVALTGAELDQIAEERFDAEVARTQVFARVSPGQKLRLVQALQRRGEIVAMTGDGVNDAPALRHADIGVAMGRTGTDAARQAADMVLTDDDFASIATAVREGRGVFDNLRKFIAWTLPANIGEGMVVLIAVLLGLTLPIVPVQILWINMSTAVFLGLTLAFEPKEPGLMRRPPRQPQQPLFTVSLLRRVVLLSILLVAAAFWAYRTELAAGAAAAAARTSAMNVFVGVQIAYLVSCRSLNRLVVRAWPGHSGMLVLGIGITVTLQLVITYVPVVNVLFHTAPVGAGTWARVLVAAAVAFVMVETDKLVWHRRPLT
ncbi:cation-translocating P-type ATPase [Amycolatopsis sp. NPDC051903]|uniref:cation-translocating P-type ATPase n=1 Tax=Amycolatopsis sp. NPDC051903 TaxID=3363936 RepID=UPI0037B7228F